MEPPAKRRRRGKSPLNQAHQDDDDELFFQPHEILAKRDSGYKLSLDRAYADNRFQATMAHIFEKYGRDFEGIGDEIDMMTGEIVVNNGHVQNMRSEVDVGVPGVGEDNENEEEGILLDDLTDGEGDQVSHLDQQGEEASEEDQDGEEDEEDQIMAGRDPHQQSTSLVPTSRAKAAPPPNSLPNLLSGLYGGGHLGYEPPPAFGASPLSFGSSPFAMGSWGLPNSFPDPWGSRDLFRKQPRLLPSPSDKHKFPVQDGRSSIWAANYRFKDDESDRRITPMSFGPNPISARTRLRPMKYPLLASAQKRRDEDVDEDVILMGKSETQDRAIEAHDPRVDDDDDLLISGTTPPSETTCKVLEPSPSPITDITTRPQTDQEKMIKQKAMQTSTSKKQRRRQEARGAPIELEPQPHGSKSKPSAYQVAPKRRDIEPSTEEEGDSSRMRSRRTRKQVGLMGKSCWTQPREGRRPQSNLTVQLPSVDLSSRDEYEIVDDTFNEVACSADEVPCVPKASKSAENMASAQRAAERVVPDSQDTSTPQSSGDAPKTSSASNLRGSSRVGRQVQNPVYLLSDDEMPILYKPKPSSGTAKSGRKSAARIGSPGPPKSGIEGSVATLSSAEDTELQNTANRTSSALQLASVQPKKRLRTKRSEGTLDHAGPEQSSVPVAAMNGKPQRLAKELLWLKRRNMDMEPTEDTSMKGAHPGCLRSADSRDDLEAAHPASGRAPAADQELDQDDAAPDVGKEDDVPPVMAADAFDSPPRRIPEPSPTKPPSTKPTPQKQNPATFKPQTPRHTSVPMHAPSSRRSILSLLSDDANQDDEGDLDELSRRSFSTAAPFLSSGAASRKIWKSSARTTEVYHTPVKRRFGNVVSPGSVVKTPGGTTRTCGLDGYRCGRDFCFSCL